MSDGVSLINVIDDDDRLVVTGEIDASTAPDLAARLDPLPGSGDVRVDMSRVEFMDSSGLRVLIDAHRRAEEAGRHLVVEHPSAPVLRVIEITGMLGHLHVAPA